MLDYACLTNQCYYAQNYAGIMCQGLTKANLFIRRWCLILHEIPVVMPNTIYYVSKIYVQESFYLMIVKDE